MKLYNILLIIGIFMLSACSEDELLDLNIDPNNPTSVPAANLVTQGQYSLYNALHSRGYNAEMSMLMVQHWSQNEYAEDSRYALDANSFDFLWIGMYSNVLNELSVAKQMISDDADIPAARKANQMGIIDIMLADAYHTITDGWGAVPFSQAINPEFPNPSYDSQEAVYSGIFSLLDNALSSMDAGSTSFASGDIVFGGDVAAWKKLGASLMMRAAMRISDVDEAKAKEYFAKALNYGPIASGADNALYQFDANPEVANPLYIDNAINNRDDFAVSDVLINRLMELNDPRLPSYAAVTNSGEYEGLPYGLTDSEAFALKSLTSRPSEVVRSADAPHVIMDFAEVSFLMAEAVERGFTTGDAAQFYNDGVGASLAYWGYADAADEYIAAIPYDASNWKAAIGEQKWLAFYMNGPQAWAEWRRLDYPQLTVPTAAVISVIPVRLPYPISEDTRNGTALSAATSDINDLTQKLWWDVN
ncbi:MAG: SusD/RagB family nutrient-binding outer membrane lipoprotein [Saprospiraceae bacterium]